MPDDDGRLGCDAARYLIEIGHSEVLRTLFGGVLTVPSVVERLSRPQTPASVREWIANPPEWLAVRRAAAIRRELVELDPGEWEAISVALEYGADLLLADDWDAREAAKRVGLRVAGTLRVFADGAAVGLIDIEEALGRLSRTSFRASPGLIQAVLRAERER